MGDSSGRSIRGARKGTPRPSATMTAGRSSRFVRASTARVDPSSGQVRIARSTRTISSDASGARISRPVAPGPGRMTFAKRSALCSTSRTARSTTGPRASVVDLEVDPTQAGQAIVEAEDPADVRESPAVDRLVVVADEEDPVGRRGQQERQPELCPIDVLDLVDEQLPAPRPPARQQRRLALEDGDRAQDEIVEVEPAGRRDRALVGDERPRGRAGIRVRRDLVGRDAELDLEPRHDGVEPQQRRLVRPGRDLGQHGRPVDHRIDGDAGVAQDLATEGVECPDADLARRHAERRHGGIEPLGHLERGPLVEGDRPDRAGRRAGRDEPRRARHEGRGLAAAGRRDAQPRARAARSRRHAGPSRAGRDARRPRDGGPSAQRAEPALSAAYPALVRRGVRARIAIHGPFTWCYRRHCTVASRGHDPLRRGPRRHGRPRW